MASNGKLKKELGLFDVFAVSTGAMFSSGFFLLPGLAAAYSGPSVILAYFVAGILILPAMFSACELSTALPRAGGAYYFLDRSLGPMFGTIGGLGVFVATTLKTAFALVGIAFYAELFYKDIPIKTVAVVLTFLFMGVNIFGAKETTWLQRILVSVLLAVLFLFVAAGLFHLLFVQESSVTSSRMSPFLAHGVGGLLATVGMVFVSYAGLTKVASVAEEVKNPERNIPLGMMLSLGITSVVYVVGVFILVALIPEPEFISDKTPVATAAQSLFDWLPGRVGVLLVVISALAAFASTGNAGLLASSRYPLAMARDNLMPRRFSGIGRFGTPVLSIVVTTGMIIFFIVAFDAKGIAKLASAFILFIFVLTCFAVIVMRESKISSYDPGYKSPLYPWMQIFGILNGIVLIAYLGWMAVAFTVGVVVACIAWYRWYAVGKVERHGAIYHWFRHLGGLQDEGLDREFRGILQEKGLRSQDPFEKIVARSQVIDIDHAQVDFEEVAGLAARSLAERLPIPETAIAEHFMKGTLTGHTPVAGTVALPHFRTATITEPELVLLRSRHTIRIPSDDPSTEQIEPDQKVRTVFFLVSPELDPQLHLRILAQIASRVSKPDFEGEWNTALNKQALREVLLRDDRFFTWVVTQAYLQGKGGVAVKDLELPTDILLAMVRRGSEIIIPKGDTELRPGDQATFIGDPANIRELKKNVQSVGD